MNNTSIQKFNVSVTFACIGALIFWSSGPIFIRFLVNYLDSWTQNMLRYLAACLFWLPFLIFILWKKQVSGNIWRRALLPTVPNIAMQSLWAAGFYYIDPAFLTLLTQCSIIWIAAFSLIFFANERPLARSVHFWLGTALSVIGIIGVIFFKKDFATTKTLTGIVIALGSSISWAVYAISVKLAFKNIDSRVGFSVTSIYTLVGLCVLALIFGNPQDCLQMSLWPWACVVISGVTAISLGHVLYYVAIKRLGATIPALVMLSQPFAVFAISNIIFSETLNALQWVFGVVLLSGSALAIWTQQYLKPGVTDGISTAKSP